MGRRLGLYAYYEYLGRDRRPMRRGLQHSRRSRVLRSILGLATYCCRNQSYGAAGQMKIIGTVLGAVGLLFYRAGGGEPRLRRSGVGRGCRRSGDRRCLSGQIEVRSQSVRDAEGHCCATTLANLTCVIKL